MKDSLKVLRLCLWCENFTGDVVTSGGCDTCGYGGVGGASYSCRLNVFEDVSPAERENLAELLATAEDCNEYHPVASVRALQDAQY
jgi:hypothetical protein